MSDFLQQSTPEIVRVLVYIAVGIGAVALILDKLGVIGSSKIIQFIASELRTDSGKTVKDLVERAADDSTEALTLAKKIEQRGRRTEKKLVIVREQIDEIRKEQKRLKEDHEGIQAKFARFVVHEAKNDLVTSRLLDEETKIVEKLEQDRDQGE